MPHKDSSRARAQLREETSRKLVQKIGEMEPYADADAEEVEERLRNMTYGATHPRVSKIRRKGSESEETA